MLTKDSIVSLEDSDRRNHSIQLSYSVLDVKPTKVYINAAGWVHGYSDTCMQDVKVMIKYIATDSYVPTRFEHTASPLKRKVDRQ